MLELGRSTTILRDHCPVVIPLTTIPLSLCQHGFDGENHTGHELDSILVAIVLWIDIKM